MQSPTESRVRVCSLLCTLVGQCTLTIGVFILLIVLVSVEMDSMAHGLVGARIRGDLSFSRASLLLPIQGAEQAARAFRKRYVAKTNDRGSPVCSMHDLSFNASSEFFLDALSVLYTHAPFIGWVNIIQTDPHRFHPTTGDHMVAQCSASVDYIFADVGGAQLYSVDPITVEQTIGGGLDNIPTRLDTETDWRYETYVITALSLTDFAWVPYMWVEPATQIPYLLLGGYGPILLNRTLANGTVETFEVDIDTPSPIKKDPRFTVVKTLLTDVRLSHVSTVVSAINPPVAGAHTSLYDLNRMNSGGEEDSRGHLLATSSNDFPLTKLTSSSGVAVASTVMHHAGETPSEALNTAFREINPQPGTPVGGSSAESAADSVRTVFKDGRVTSVIHLRTESNIDFAIVQSTPDEFYFAPLRNLRIVMIITGVLAACAVTAVGAFIVLSIRVKLTEIAQGMKLAAALKNDKVLPVSALMSEIDTLCVAFGEMNARLGAARAFMPQWMLVDANGTTDESEADDNNANDTDKDEGPLNLKKAKGDAGDFSKSPSGSTHDVDMHHRRRTNYNGSNKHGAGDNASHSTATTHGTSSQIAAAVVAASSSAATGHSSSMLAHTPAASAAAAAPQTRRVTILCVNTRGFNKKGSDAAAVFAASTQLTTAIQSLTQQFRGVIDTFHGDRFVLSFNAAKRNAQGPLQAVQCGLAIEAALNQNYTTNNNTTNDNRESSAPSSLILCDPDQVTCVTSGENSAVNTPIKNNGAAPHFLTQHYGAANSKLSGGLPLFSMGASSGRAFVGNLGSSSVKRFSIIGRVYSRAVALESMCKRFAYESVGRRNSHNAISASLCIDDAVAAEVDHSFFLQAIGKLCEAKRPPFTLSLAAASPPPLRPTATHHTASVPSTDNTSAFVYVVRGASRHVHSNNNGGGGGDEDAGDEWLYELRDRFGGGGGGAGGADDLGGVASLSVSSAPQHVLAVLNRALRSLLAGPHFSDLLLGTAGLNDGDHQNNNNNNIYVSGGGNDGSSRRLLGGASWGGGGGGGGGAQSTASMFAEALAYRETAAAVGAILHARMLAKTLDDSIHNTSSKNAGAAAASAVGWACCAAACERAVFLTGGATLENPEAVLAPMLHPKIRYFNLLFCL